MIAYLRVTFAGITNEIVAAITNENVTAANVLHDQRHQHLACIDEFVSICAPLRKYLPAVGSEYLYVQYVAPGGDVIYNVCSSS